MFQTFEVTARPEQGPPRLAALRAEMAAAGVQGFLVPRADAHQGEYVAPRDARLAWLTGFTGSAAFCAVLADVAGVFIDGRYRTQVKAQVADVYSPVPWPDVGLAEWLKQHCSGGKIGYDPWLHTVAEVERLRAGLKGTGVEMVQCANLVDLIWDDQPLPPMAPVKAHPIEFAGQSSADKIAQLAGDLRAAGHDAAVITLPDSIMWLLNIRGADIARNPVAHGFAVLHGSGRVDLFMDSAKLEGVALDDAAAVHPANGFLDALAALEGQVRIDRTTAPQIVGKVLGSRAVFGDEPCALPKARKNAAEIAGTEAAHLRDGAAMVEFLTWLDAQAPGSLHETDAVRHLEACRRKDNALQDISFETIAGTGPNGAIMHYRVSEETDSVMQDGHLLVLDSGGQYLDGTTDITRTIAIGDVGADERAAFTRVLQGMIAMSRLVWPAGLAGRDIEAIGRVPLWLAGQDFNHGLGHGVGTYLSVHEGPQRLSKLSHVPFEPGMILSNEPGYYREGAFGIRIENLLVVEPRVVPGGDPERSFLGWKTLAYVPIDRRLIDVDRLSGDEREWLNGYHRDVVERIGPRVGKDAQTWLDAACAAL
ncbi:MAG: aminopeptidase P family protein [Sedimentitalea sp.]